MDISYFYNEPVTLKLLPVCECGYVFEDGICITKEIESMKEYKYAFYSMQPATCPNCNRRIKAVSYDKNLLREDFKW